MSLYIYLVKFKHTKFNINQYLLYIIYLTSYKNFVFILFK